jgi:hypothetical protein
MERWNPSRKIAVPNNVPHVSRLKRNRVFIAFSPILITTLPVGVPYQGIMVI